MIQIVKYLAKKTDRIQPITKCQFYVIITKVSLCKELTKF